MLEHPHAHTHMHTWSSASRTSDIHAEIFPSSLGSAASLCWQRVEGSGFRVLVVPWLPPGRSVFDRSRGLNKLEMADAPVPRVCQMMCAGHAPGQSLRRFGNFMVRFGFCGRAGTPKVT